VRAAATASLVVVGTVRLVGALAVNRVRRREPRAAVAARVLARTLERLGPSYAKLGQILATRRNVNDGARCARITLETAAFVPDDLPYARFEADLSKLVARASAAAVADFSVAGFVLGPFELQRR
jgi:hypothetical protein